ncbi:hypothetical protein [Adhaeribacter aquaticus]|uniref:hypothetical protein n=1 Tax=Adhaeribacter aquaticus TaxID=299567 RepID=UPI000404713B|nr:hypothetical protein [Adhaeribacter aquaticus]
MAKKKKTSEKKARVHKELEGFEIKINPLGEISSNFDIDQINKFLDKNVYDKKLVNRDEEDDEYHIEENADSDENEVDFLDSSDDDDPETPPRPLKS